MSPLSRWWRVGAAMLVALALPGFTLPGSAGPAGPVTIGFLEKWPEPQYAPYFHKVVADYQQLHPNVTIDLQAVADQPYKDKIRVMTAAGALPDIFFAWPGDFATKFVRAGLAADLTKAFYGSDWHTRLGQGPVEAFTYRGRLYGIPMDVQAKFFTYNVAIFRHNGIVPPKTLPELFAACDKLKRNGVAPLGFGNTFGWPAIHYITTLNSVYVPQAVLQRDYTPETGEFTDSGYVQALATLKQLLDTCMVSPTQANGVTNDAAIAEFQTGRTAFMYNNNYWFPYFTTSGGAPSTIVDNWNYFKFPSVPGARGDQAFLTGAPDGFMVSSRTKHMDVVIDFLQFFTSKSNAQLMTKMLGWGSPVIGSATAENTFPLLRQSIDDINQARGMAVWLDTATNALVAQAYLAGTEGLINGTKTPEQVMKSVQEAAQAAKKEVTGK